ncbi:BQ5605_C005g03569 [Microbotryum silenes-dioicae]|uniref:BQ5605_C005g03569 protein n=1 Tax=Microbotryum silenes-dioicae TaxID=796604 RepID=A0A2X0MF82_9BASI|nr:BQ5605_C005g03569 [Microbotryum silenes-dioicae]
MSSKRKWDDAGATEDAALKQPKTEPENDVERSTSSASAAPEPAVNAVEDPKAAIDAAAEVAARLAAQYGGKPAPAPAQPDPEFVKDIEINDLRNRYLLTKEPTQQQILEETGASVVTRGSWFPDKSMASDKDPALYLHITADTAEKLDKGIAAVQALMDTELGPLIDTRRFERAAEREQPRERRKWPEEKIPIELEPMRNFNVRAKVVGPGGLFVKYIQHETQTRVQIKGMGSGFIETDTGREAEETMHVHVTGPDQPMVDEAAEMARDLLIVVKEEHAKARAALEQQFQQQQQYQQQQQQLYAQQQSYGGGYQQQGPGQGSYPQQGYQQSYAPGVTAPLPPGEAPPPPPGEAPPLPTSEPPPQPAGGTATDEQWRAYWNSLDGPSQAYFMQYYVGIPGSDPPITRPEHGADFGFVSQASAYTQPIAAPAPPSAPPPPPPPPAEPPRGGSGMYGAVPPPPGL